MNKQFSIFNFQFSNYFVLGLLILFGIWSANWRIGFPGANAQQTPEFMITWKANSYVPSDYAGKPLPNGQSSVEIAFELLDRGRTANLSHNEIRWFLNNNLIASGLGLKTISYQPPRLSRENLNFRIEVLGYGGQNLEDTITIPVVSPMVVIDFPSPNNRLTGDETAFRALPYFFNASSKNQLSFQWAANNQTASGDPENPDILTLDTSGIPERLPIGISATIQNLVRQIERALKSINVVK